MIKDEFVLLSPEGPILNIDRIESIALQPNNVTRITMIPASDKEIVYWELEGEDAYAFWRMFASELEGGEK